MTFLDIFVIIIDSFGGNMDNLENMKKENIKVNKINLKKILKVGTLALAIVTGANAYASYERHKDEKEFDSFTQIGAVDNFYTNNLDWFKKHYDFRVVEASKYDKDAALKIKNFNESATSSVAINVELDGVKDRADLWLKYKDLKENIKRTDNTRYGVYWDVDDLFENKNLSTDNINSMLDEMRVQSSVDKIFFGIKGHEENLERVSKEFNSPKWLVNNEINETDINKLDNVDIISNENMSYIRSVAGRDEFYDNDYHDSSMFTKPEKIKVLDETPREIADKYGWSIEEVEKYNKKKIEKDAEIEVPVKVKTR